MKNQWSQFPFVLRRKILLTFLAGVASIAVSLVIFTVAADRILLVLGGFIFAASLVLGSSLWRTAARGRYEVVEGICAGVSTPMLRRYRKIQLIDEQGAERTLLLSKTAKFQIGARYRFYFQKGSRPAVGNDYLDAALSTNSFLGYEVLEDTISLCPAAQDPADIPGRDRQHSSQPCDLHCHRRPHPSGAGWTYFCRFSGAGQQPMAHRRPGPVRSGRRDLRRRQHPYAASLPQDPAD